MGKQFNSVLPRWITVGLAALTFLVAAVFAWANLDNRVQANKVLLANTIEAQQEFQRDSDIRQRQLIKDVASIASKVDALLKIAKNGRNP